MVAGLRDINYIILTMVTGAILLASVYHTVLFAHNRLRLIGYYALYLWSAFAYCLFRCIYPHQTPAWILLDTDEALQMASFALYIRFTRVAMNLDRHQDRLAYWFCAKAPAIVFLYIVVERALYYLGSHKPGWTGTYLCLFFGIRVFLLLVGLTGAVAVIRKRSQLYYRYIFYAVLSLILSGLLSTILKMLRMYEAGSYCLSALVTGFAIDVCFFSAAISYKMRTETVEKEMANRRILEQELELRKVETEQLVFSYKAKEEERSRIAMELHDEIGSTLSSISILSDVITKEQNETSKTAMQQEVSSNSKLMMEKMDDIIFSLNPRNDSMEQMLLRIRQFATPLFEAKGIDYDFHFAEGVKAAALSVEQRQQVYLILKEAINNLVKHAGCSIASVRAEIDVDEIIFTLKENGKGFDTAAEAAGNGLYSMKHRAEKIGASLSFSSLPGIETAIRLSLKIG